jgi:pyruvate dehydrogenase E1 component
MAFARLLRNLVRDEKVGSRVVPIIPDEARTFGLDALFREIGIYAAMGQLYEPVDAGMQLSYREAQNGQILEEGITEAGALASFTAASTAYATHDVGMLPFYIFYSMFGFQRVGDLIWAASDQRARGFLLGATAGRTTLNGEGLQHEDGHSLLVASAYPSVQAYDPAFAYELATIIKAGCKRMFLDGEDIIYYLTLYNENYAMPAMPEGIEDELLAGLYRFQGQPEGTSTKATVLFSGPSWQWASKAREELAAHYDVGVELWSATSYKALREDALDAERWNRLHPSQPPRTSFVASQLSRASGPYVAVSDYVKAVPDQIARWVPGSWSSLGTDGFGRSDTRANLRAFFEVDRYWIAHAALSALAAEGRMNPEDVARAIKQWKLDPEKPNPLTV